MQLIRAKYFVNRPTTFCDWNGAHEAVMTLICSEGHSEHDELSCVSTVFWVKYLNPKAHRTRRRDLPIPQYHPFLKWGAQGEKPPKMIPSFTV